MAVEQAPRFAEFLTVYNKEGNTQEGLAKAMYAAADVTVNFGRSGTWGRTMNRTFVPFFNPSVQGFSKMIREFTGAKRRAEMDDACYQGRSTRHSTRTIDHAFVWWWWRIHKDEETRQRHKLPIQSSWGFMGEDSQRPCTVNFTRRNKARRKHFKGQRGRMGGVYWICRSTSKAR